MALTSCNIALITLWYTFKINMSARWTFLITKWTLKRYCENSKSGQSQSCWWAAYTLQLTACSGWFLYTCKKNICSGISLQRSKTHRYSSSLKLRVTAMAARNTFWRCEINTYTTPLMSFRCSNSLIGRLSILSEMNCMPQSIWPYVYSQVIIYHLGHHPSDFTHIFISQCCSLTRTPVQLLQDPSPKS